MARRKGPLEVKPRVRASVMRRLSERLAMRVDTVAELVKPDHLVSGYLSDDPQDRDRFADLLVDMFSVPIEGSELRADLTVDGLAEMIAYRRVNRGRGERVYIVQYQNKDGQVIESHVQADNHEAAVEALRAEGLVEVLGIERADIEDSRGPGRFRSWKSFLLLVTIALLGAGLFVAYYWYRHR